MKGLFWKIDYNEFICRMRQRDSPGIPRGEVREPWMKGVGSRSPQGAVLPTGNACQPSRCPSSTCVPTGGASKMGRALGWRPPGIYLQAAHLQAHHVLNYKHKIAPGDSTCWASSVEVGKVGVGDGGEINQGRRVR